MGSDTDKILFMADCHVKGRTWTNDAGVQRDAYEALSAVHCGVTAMGLDPGSMPLLVGGDLFDCNRPSSEDVLQVSEFLKLFRKTYFIPGNHDSVWPPFAEAMFNADGMTGEDGDRLMCIQQWDLEEHDSYTLGGVSWMPSGERLVEALSQYRKCLDKGKRHFIMLHTGVKELLGYDGTWQVDCGTLHGMFKGLAVTFLVGHVHVRKTLDLGDGVVVHSPGSLYPCKWDETRMEHAVTVIDTATGGLADVPVEVRRYVDFRWGGYADALERAVRPVLGCRMPLAPVVRVGYSGDVPPASSLPLADRVVYRLVDESVAGDSLPSCSCDSMSIEGAIREELDDGDMADMAVALYESDDPVAEIERWLNEWGVERLV